MDQQTFMEIATVVSKLKMYPYFDVAGYILMCLVVREDNSPVQGGSGLVLFSRKHPLSCWVATMLLCFAGGIIANFLVGESVLIPFKDHQAVLTASACWYLVNYSPFDLVYKLCKFGPVKLVLFVLKEVQRTNKVHHGVMYAAKLYPGSYLIIVIIGVIKGAASGHMRMLSRLVCGSWIPSSNEFIKPGFVSKGCIAASIVFILERKGLIQAPHPVIYFGVVLFFVYFRISSILLGIHDPFVPFENLFCAVFMGGMWDAMKRAVSSQPEETATENGANSVTKNKDDKKRD